MCAASTAPSYAAETASLKANQSQQKLPKSPCNLGSKNQLKSELIGHDGPGAQAIHFAGWKREKCKKDKLPVKPTVLVVVSNSLDRIKEACACEPHATVVLLESMTVPKSLLKAYLKPAFLGLPTFL